MSRSTALRRIAPALFLCILAGAGSGVGRAQPANATRGLPPDIPAEGSVELEVLRDFQRDPKGNAGALLRLGSRSAQHLPVALLLAAADVHLRAGRYRSAGRFFAEVVSRGAGEPWTAYAELGLGWTALARGDPAAAARHYQRVPAPPDVAVIAEVMLGWTAAVDGRSGDAVASLDRIAAGRAPENVRAAALLGAGYARYWAGSYDEAASTFARLALLAPASRLADDARYAAAMSLLQAGDRARALDELAALAGSGGDASPSRAVSRAALELAPHAVLRGRRTAEPISGFAMPDVRMVGMLDRDGRALARAALARLATGPSAHAPSVAAPAVRRSELAEPAVTAAAPGERHAAAVKRGWPVTALWITALVALLATLLWRLRRNAPAA